MNNKMENIVTSVVERLDVFMYFDSLERLFHIVLNRGLKGYRSYSIRLMFA